MKKAVLFDRVRKGFTLVQVSIAVLILGIGLIPAMQVIQESNRYVYKSEAILEASLVGQAIIDEVKTEASLEQFMNKTVKLPDEAYKNFIIPENFQKKFKGWAELKVEVAANHTVPDRGLIEDMLREITVTVHWEELGKKQETRLATYLANINRNRLNAFNRFR